MPKQKPENQLCDEEQKKRFVEAEKKAEVDNKAAENAFKKIASSENEVDG